MVIRYDNAYGQDKEAGLKIGMTGYMGDLTESHLTFSQNKLSIGGFFRYYFSPKMSVSANLFLGWLEGSDLDYATTDPSDESGNWRRRRNLDFKTHVIDLSGQFEYNFLPFISGHPIRKWTPYVFAGVGAFHFNPKTEYNGETVELQPLQTEGTDYSLFQFVVPYGVGFRYSFPSLWNIGFEISQRYTFTDYIDDVSDVYVDKSTATNPLEIALADRSQEAQNPPKELFKPGMGRGNPDDNDVYIWTGITISKVFRKKTCFGF